MRSSQGGDPRVNDFTIIEKGVLTVNIESGETIHYGEYAHGLDFAPAVFFYLRDEAFNYQQIPCQLYFPSFVDNYRSGCNSTHIWVRLDMSDAPISDSTQDFYFFILNNSLSVFDTL